MNEDSVLLFMKVMCVVARLYIAAAIVYCLPWLFGVRQPASKSLIYRLDKDVRRGDGAQAEST